MDKKIAVRVVIEITAFAKVYSCDSYHFAVNSFFVPLVVLV